MDDRAWPAIRFAEYRPLLVSASRLLGPLAGAAVALAQTRLELGRGGRLAAIDDRDGVAHLARLDLLVLAGRSPRRRSA